jgi:hypothetical protein
MPRYSNIGREDGFKTRKVWVQVPPGAPRNILACSVVRPRFCQWCVPFLKDVWKLRIICADAWPGLIRECERAIRSIRPGNSVSIQQKPGCVEVSSCSKHWPCLFPQHGPGRKHMRTITLQPWQRVVVLARPGHFVRGLFHSDGYRGINRVRAHLAEGDRWYEYPRYLFTNESGDILRLCGETLDQLGVAWRFSRWNAISVARREAVARLDEFVGPKY